ncbi:ATP-binding protein [Nonomuraea sp. PA05]|uniref:ATP-binding protein n=1 Tax=Nonomuraea sp. PA05 TaxID=2604466 RepID=UPI0016523BA5|nr:ATP-binding protein [Nonomuraea sp. PA05]
MTGTERREFPSLLEELGRVRRFVVGVVAGHPAEDDVVLAVSELAANAVEHSAARRDDSFEVRITHLADAVRVEVHDHGGAGRPRPGVAGAEATRGRGLFLVDHLSRDWGITHKPDHTDVWCEIGCTCTESTGLGTAAA